MMADLFDTLPKLRHRRGPDTERAALARAKATRPTMLARIEELIAFAGSDGMTNAEVCAAIGKAKHSVSARLTELRDANRIKDSGRRRENCDGNREIVWIMA